MQTIRPSFGLVGFSKRDESDNDAFGVGHSFTSISADLGKIFGLTESLIVDAEKDDKIVAIHAAMVDGTRLNLFQKHFWADVSLRE